MPATKSVRSAGRRTSRCPISRTLDLLGDRWSLLVVRDLMFFDKHTFNDFLGAPEGIPTSVLADRLNRLLNARVISRKPYQTNPVRYQYFLADAGKKLEPVLLTLFAWGNDHLLGGRAAKTCPSKALLSRAYS